MLDGGDSLPDVGVRGEVGVLRQVDGEFQLRHGEPSIDDGAYEHVIDLHPVASVQDEFHINNLIEAQGLCAITDIFTFFDYSLEKSPRKGQKEP